MSLLSSGQAEQAQELEPAYAITVHKSQGCEFKAVILCISDTAKELQYRNLLYTGVTRAKTILILIGGREQVSRMVKNDRKTLRYSCIKALLDGEMNGRSEL